MVSELTVPKVVCELNVGGAKEVLVRVEVDNVVVMAKRLVDRRREGVAIGRPVMEELSKRLTVKSEFVWFVVYVVVKSRHKSFAGSALK